MSPPSPAEINTIFELLQNHRRRYVLHYLRQEETAGDVRDLATALARWETDDEPVTEAQIADVETALVHVHVPKLAKSGIVAYDPDTETVSLADAGAIEPYLTVVEQVDRPAHVPGDD